MCIAAAMVKPALSTWWAENWQEPSPAVCPQRWFSIAGETSKDKSRAAEKQEELLRGLLPSTERTELGWVGGKVYVWPSALNDKLIRNRVGWNLPRMLFPASA